jgi:hypothetical protein
MFLISTFDAFLIRIPNPLSVASSPIPSRVIPHERRFESPFPEITRSPPSRVDGSVIQPMILISRGLES